MTYMTKLKAEERREAEPAGNMPRPEVAVIGGGAAGMMTAATAARHGAAVTLFEREEKRGRKLGITGKGRCNLTNDCTRDEFMENVHARQLYDTGVAAEYGDQLLTLSTCEYTYPNGRFVVVAKKA